MRRMTSKWFWCPRCHNIAPQLTVWQIARLKHAHEDFDKIEIIRKIAFILANPLLMLKLYFRLFVNINRSLHCSPCGFIKMKLLKSKSPEVLSASNYVDLVKAGLIRR